MESYGVNHQRSKIKEFRSPQIESGSTSGGCCEAPKHQELDRAKSRGNWKGTWNQYWRGSVTVIMMSDTYYAFTSCQPWAKCSKSIISLNHYKPCKGKLTTDTKSLNHSTATWRISMSSERVFVKWWLSDCSEQKKWLILEPPLAVTANHFTDAVLCGGASTLIVLWKNNQCQLLARGMQNFHEVVETPTESDWK